MEYVFSYDPPVNMKTYVHRVGRTARAGNHGMMSFKFYCIMCINFTRGVVVKCCNPLILHPEQSGGNGSILGRAPLFEHHDVESQTQFRRLYFGDPSACR